MLETGEWQFASAVSLLEAYPGRGYARAVRAEQPIFFVCWDEKSLYVAMRSIDSNTNTIVAACSMHDNVRIIGDDCVELMIAPGAGEDLKRFDFPTYYFAFNSIGTVWDAKFITLLNEKHNSWESGAEIEHKVDGTLWTSEMRIPLAAISKERPSEGTVWRMNFDRTYRGYHWSAWNAGGGLNDARIGGNVTFSKKSPAVRLVDVYPITVGKLQVTFAAANPTGTPQSLRFNVQCSGQPEKGKPPVKVGEVEKKITIEPGKVTEVILGQGEKLLPYNRLAIQVAGEDGARLFSINRAVHVPSLRFQKRVARSVPLVYVFPRFLPSLERLSVLVDTTAWMKKTGYVGKSPSAQIQVFAKGDAAGKPLFQGVLKDFKDSREVWRHSTKELPEGEYEVRVKVMAGNGELIAKHDDWFEKRIFDWMKRPRGLITEVPDPYTPLKATGNEVELWGRSYRFTDAGLPDAVVSQGKSWLAGSSSLDATVNGKRITPQTSSRFVFNERKPFKVTGSSELMLGDVVITISTTIEYDGFMLFRLTCRPKDEMATIDRLRLRMPLSAKHAKFLSAAGDTQGTNIIGALVPQNPGTIYDSSKDTFSVTLSPTFATLFWLGDHETCFCYAADNDKGWAVRDDAPAVEAVREGDQINLWLNLIDRPIQLKAPRVLEFAFQAGPTKPLPQGWRGIQDAGDVSNAPLTLIQLGGGGHTLAGGSNFIHPGTTSEQIRKSKARIDKAIGGKSRTIVGYHYWGTVPKGLPETRVFRGEWGIDKFAWDHAKHANAWMWKNRYFGDNRDLYVLMHIKPVPSYVEFCLYGYDEALKHTRLSGFYDDTGYPKPVYDEELGLGYVREDGRKVYSSGLWIYRERWKRTSYLNHVHQRPNHLRDSQHMHAHFMPAYGFIGIWAPCERGYYNPFPDRDNLGFYGSIDRYASFNPSRAFGQIPMIGMSSTQREAPAIRRDTRNMMMLALLNDQDVGTFGRRDLLTVSRLRRARNHMRQWKEEVRFIGYWESSQLVKASSKDVLISIWSAKGRALFAAGNTGEGNVKATISVDWEKLNLNHRQFDLVNTETGRIISISGNGEFSAFIPRHDVRLLLAAPKGTVRLQFENPGTELPRPRNILVEFSDTFEDEQLSPGWKAGLHEGNAGVYLMDGRLCVQGAHYGYAHVRRKMGIDNITVQCQILRKPTGSMDSSAGSLFLYWKNRSYLQALPGVNRGQFLYTVSGKGRHSGSAISKGPLPGWYPFSTNWVRIELQADSIIFSGSNDGKTWKQDWKVNRPEKFRGPPEFLILGNGHPGKEPFLSNVISKHFRAHGHYPNPMTFFDDLIVGKGDRQ